METYSFRSIWFCYNIKVWKGPGQGIVHRRGLGQSQGDQMEEQGDHGMEHDERQPSGPANRYGNSKI